MARDATLEEHKQLFLQQEIFVLRRMTEVFGNRDFISAAVLCRQSYKRDGEFSGDFEQLFDADGEVKTGSDSDHGHLYDPDRVSPATAFGISARERLITDAIRFSVGSEIMDSEVYQNLLRNMPDDPAEQVQTLSIIRAMSKSSENVFQQVAARLQESKINNWLETNPRSVAINPTTKRAINQLLIEKLERYIATPDLPEQQKKQAKQELNDLRQAELNVSCDDLERECNHRYNQHGARRVRASIALKVVSAVRAASKKPNANRKKLIEAVKATRAVVRTDRLHVGSGTKRNLRRITRSLPKSPLRSALQGLLKATRFLFGRKRTTTDKRATVKSTLWSLTETLKKQKNQPTQYQHSTHSSRQDIERPRSGPRR